MLLRMFLPMFGAQLYTRSLMKREMPYRQLNGMRPIVCMTANIR